MDAIAMRRTSRMLPLMAAMIFKTKRVQMRTQQLGTTMRKNGSEDRRSIQLSYGRKPAFSHAQNVVSKWTWAFRWVFRNGIPWRVRPPFSGPESRWSQACSASKSRSLGAMSRRPLSFNMSRCGGDQS